MLVLPSQWQKVHQLLTIPNTARRELLEQLLLPSLGVWPRSRHPARRALQCPSAQQRNAQGQGAKIISFQQRKIALHALVTLQLVISICLTILRKHHSYLTFPACFPTAEDGEKPHSRPLPHLGTSPESSSAPRTHVALLAPRYHPGHARGEAQRWLWQAPG